MIVTFDQIKDIPDDDLYEMIQICHNNEEMFCLMLNSTHIRSSRVNDDISISELHLPSMKIACLPDMIIMQHRDGTFTEMKNRWNRFGHVKLVTEEVITKVTKVVVAHE